MPTRIPVLTYHAVEAGSSPIAISPQAFASQMGWLSRHGYRVIRLSELVGHFEAASALPPRTVVITFDDGFESVYLHAFPILAEYGFPASVFLVTGYCGRYNDWPGQPSGFPIRSLLTWGQISEMGRHGIEYGAHTVTHPRLDRAPTNEIVHEITRSKETIEQQIGKPVELFAYPYGRFDGRVKEVVRGLFRGACTGRLDLADLRRDPLEIDRVDVYYARQPFLFRLISHPVMVAYLWMRRPLRRLTSAALGRAWN